MNGGRLSVRSLAKRLARLPRRGDPQPLAGMPFELPYSLNLPDQWDERWRRHLDLLDAAKAQIDALLATAPPQADIDLLKGQLDTDGRDNTEGRRQQIATFLAAGPP